MAGTTVTLTGMEKLQAKLKRALDPFEEMLSTLAEFIHQEARTRAKPHAADKGTLGNVIKVSFAGEGVKLSAKVYEPKAVVGIALSVEEGRGPGKPPPVASIGRWAKSHGIATKPWLLAQQIKAHGTKGIHFMAGAADAGEKKAKELIGKTAAMIEHKWGA